MRDDANAELSQPKRKLENFCCRRTKEMSDDDQNALRKSTSKSGWDCEEGTFFLPKNGD